LPFKHLKDNIIEMVNDLILVALSLTFTIWQDKSSCNNDTVTDVVISKKLMLSNNYPKNEN